MHRILRSAALLALSLGLSALPGRTRADDEPPTLAQAMPAWNVSGQARTSASQEAQRETEEEAPAEAEASHEPEATTKPEAKRHEGRFEFGSYGRVRAASDLRGKGGKSSNIVAFGGRNDLDNYAELELRREDEVDQLQLRVVATLAVAGDFFHYDGEFQENLAVRNLFADVSNVFIKGLAVWAGSRMARGDDVYLLNFWPLDNLNLLGGGARLVRERFELFAHGGLTRPNNPFYKQTIDVVPALGFTPAKYDLLDRPRSVVAFKGTYFPMGRLPNAFKTSLYLEAHNLPKGTRENESHQLEHLPADAGLVAGAQLGGWLERPRSFVNLFLRYAQGIAVYDPLATPMQIGTVVSAQHAREWRVALAGNLETHALGLQLGGYVRDVRDEANTALAGGHMLEGAVDARPYLWFNDYSGLSVDGGYQALAVSKLDDRTGKPVRGSVSKLAVIPFISPYGRGTYTRPHLHIIYQLSMRDAGARHLYSERDARSSQSLEHFFAVGAEWWFNSTSY